MKFYYLILLTGGVPIMYADKEKAVEKTQEIIGFLESLGTTVTRCHEYDDVETTLCRFKCEDAPPITIYKLKVTG